MKALAASVFITALSLPVAQARDFRDLTNLDGRTIKAELIDLTPEGILKINLDLKPYDIPLSSLCEADREWLLAWDIERRLGKDAAYYRKEIFSDDFSAADFGERWGHYKSGSVVRDGVLVGITPEGSDHSAVDNIRFDGERDLEVSVKFQFVSDKAQSFNVWLDDKDYKGSHAGHITSVTVSPAAVTIADAKTGAFENAIYEKRQKADGLTPELQEILATKTTRVPVDLSLNEWHTLLIRTREDRIEVSIDAEKAGEFQSGGIAHETKSLVSLTTNPVDVHYDDFAVKAGVALEEEKK